jgi:CubicO group peptidase (beta-lactamase class C family)
MIDLRMFKLCLVIIILLLDGNRLLSAASLDASKLAAVDTAIIDALKRRKMPGAVIWIERNGECYHKDFGYRALVPRREIMTEDTIFDVASLTKVIATTPAVLLLIERGLIQLDDPIKKYLSGFDGSGREKITIKNLLTHTSGLPRGFEPKTQISNYKSGIEAAFASPLRRPSGTSVVYGDINFLLLGEIVQRVTGMRLDKFVSAEIYTPLKMVDTGFLPPTNKQAKVAPTLGGLRGKVHDPIASRMGGVVGNAGIFTTAADLSRFARMLLNNGVLDGFRLFKPETIALMTHVQTPESQSVRGGLGWDIDSPYSYPRGNIFPLGSYGHTGYTGTAIWIDPYSKTFWILLTNRLHPNGNGSVTKLEQELGTLVANAVVDFDFQKVTGALPENVKHNP